MKICRALGCFYTHNVTYGIKLRKQQQHCVLFCSRTLKNTSTRLFFNQTADFFSAQTKLYISLSSSHPNTLWLSHPFQHTPRDKKHQETKKTLKKQSDTNKWNVALAETTDTWWRNGNRRQCNPFGILAKHTHTDWILINITPALGICYKWWNRNVLRHIEIGFFVDTLTSCSWEDWDLILTGSQHRLQPAVCERRPAAARGNISSRLLEAPAAAGIIFGVLIYSGPIFEKPSRGKI